MTAHYITGLDIGGTKIAATLAGRDGLLQRQTQPTVLSGTEQALPQQCIAMIDAMCAAAGVPPAQVCAVGIGSTGPFVQRDGLLALASPNLCGRQSGASDLPNDWDAVPLQQMLLSRFEQVVMCNDAVAALNAERFFGAVQTEDHCAYVTWSTGIGFGLCVDGRILHGKHGNAGHAGHMLMTDASDARCGCGNRGDVESLVSGRNLARRHGRDTAALFAAARARSPEEYALVAEAARWLGRALYNVTAMLDTRTFVIGGGIWQHHGDWLRPLLLQELAGRLPALTAEVRLIDAELGSLVGDIGALCQVMPTEWVTHWRATRPWES
ncbi:MAG: ROK family protein [Proteobacteria bacterium]|nr:ROK family protein [Pseudomonadota bacterium]